MQVIHTHTRLTRSRNLHRLALRLSLPLLVFLLLQPPFGIWRAVVFSPLGPLSDAVIIENMVAESSTSLKGLIAKQTRVHRVGVLHLQKLKCI